MRYISCLLVFLMAVNLIFAQKFAPKEYYLVDSLMYDDLSAEDKKIIDSSLTIYHSNVHDTLKIKAINTIVENSWSDDVWPTYNEFLMHYLLNKINTEEEQKIRRFYYKIYANTLNNKGLVMRTTGNLKEALELYYKCLEILEKEGFHHNMATTNNNIGMVYLDYGDIEKGLEYYYKSLNDEEKYGDSLGVAISLNNIGYVYYNQKDKDNAVKYFTKSLAYLEALNQQNAVATLLNNIGGIYKDFSPEDDTQSYKTAINYFKKSLQLYTKINDHVGMARAYSNIGSSLVMLNRLDSAKYYAQQGFDLRKKYNLRSDLPNSLLGLAEIYMQQDSLQLAKKTILNAFEISKEIGLIEGVSDASRVLVNVYTKEKNWEKALKYHRVYIESRDSIMNKNVEKTTIKQQAKYELEKIQALKNAEYEKQLEIDKQIQDKQFIVICGIVIILIIILIFSVLLFKKLNLTKQQKQIIAETNEELNLTNEQLATQRDELQSKNHKIISSINYAKRIQDALLKNEEHESEHIPPHFILFKPKDIVSGDFYWALEKVDIANKNEKYLYLASVDCTGHGVPGAFLTMLGTSFLNEINSTPTLLSPAKILDKLRTKIIKELSSDGQTKDGMDISLLKLHLNTTEIEWAGANNPLYIITKFDNSLTSNLESAETIQLNNQKTDQIIITKGDKQPIGYVESPKPFTNHKFKLQKGDQIYLFTDGYADQFGGEKGRKLGYKNFRNKLLELSTLEMENQKEELNLYFENWKQNEEQIDDVCVIGVKI